MALSKTHLASNPGYIAALCGAKVACGGPTYLTIMLDTTDCQDCLLAEVKKRGERIVALEEEIERLKELLSPTR